MGIYGVPVAAVYGHGDDAVPVDSQYGEPSMRAVGYNYGVPVPDWHGVDTVPEHTGCLGITKKGDPCKAPKAKGTDLCVGHLRSQATKES